MMILFSQRHHVPTLTLLILMTAPGCFGGDEASSATPDPPTGELTTLVAHQEADPSGEPDPTEESDPTLVSQWSARLEAIDRAEMERELELDEVLERAVIHGQLLEVGEDSDTHLLGVMSGYQRASTTIAMVVDQFQQHLGDRWSPLAHGLVASGFLEVARPLEYVLAHYQRANNEEAHQAIRQLVEVNLSQGIEHARRGYELVKHEGFDQTRRSMVRTYVFLLVEDGKLKATIHQDDAASKVFATASQVLQKEIAAIDSFQGFSSEEDGFDYEEYHQKLKHWGAIIDESRSHKGMPKTVDRPGLDVSRTDVSSDTTQHQQLAASIRDGDMEAFLRGLDSITNVDAAFEQGKRLLEIAIETREHLAVQAICKAGANVNQVNERGQSPLHLALHQSDFVSASLLLKHGANSLLEDPQGITPCDLLRDIHQLEFTPTSDEFAQFHDAFLRKRIEVSLGQIRGRVRSARELVQLGTNILMENSGDFSGIPSQQSATVLSAPQTSGTAVVLGGLNVDSLPMSLRDEHFRRFREQRAVKIDLTPTAQEAEFLRESAMETAEIWRQNGRETIAFAQEHLAAAIEEGVIVLMCAELRWGKGDDEYQQVCEELEDILAGNEPPQFDPNAYQNPGFRPTPDGHVIGSPSVFDW